MVASHASCTKGVIFNVSTFASDAAITLRHHQDAVDDNVLFGFEVSGVFADGMPAYAKYFANLCLIASGGNQ